MVIELSGIRSEIIRAIIKKSEEHDYRQSCRVAELQSCHYQSIISITQKKFYHGRSKMKGNVVFKSSYVSSRRGKNQKILHCFIISVFEFVVVARRL